MVSIKRLAEFLRADELQADARTIVQQQSRLELNDEVLSISNGEFAWSKTTAVPILDDVNLTVRKGELLGVLGRVGAGKVRHSFIRGFYMIYDHSVR